MGYGHGVQAYVAFVRLHLIGGVLPICEAASLLISITGTIKPIRFKRDCEERERFKVTVKMP